MDRRSIRVAFDLFTIEIGIIEKDGARDGRLFVLGINKSKAEKRCVRKFIVYQIYR